MDRKTALSPAPEPRHRSRKWMVATAIAAFVIAIGLFAGTALKLADPAYRRNASTPPAAEPLPAVPPALAGSDGADEVSPGSGNGQTRASGGATTSEKSAPVTQGGGDGEGRIVPAEADKIVKTGEVAVAIQGDSIQPSFTAASGIARELGGFTSSSSTRNDGQALLTIRVPSNRFEELIEKVGKLGEVKSLSTNATDVTGQVVDLEARIRNLEAQRDQIMLLMSKATTVQETMTIQDRLFAVTSQIEQLKGRLNALNSKTEYSTLNVTLATTTAPAPTGGGWGTSRALSRAAHAFVDTLNGFIVLMGPLGFIALLALGVWLVLRPIVRRRRALPTEPAPESRAAA